LVLDEYYAAKLVEKNDKKTQANCFKAIAGEMETLQASY